MAARHMQRMRALQEAEKASEGAAVSSDNSDTDDDGAPSSVPFNPFDLLDEDDDAEEPQSEKEEEDGDAHEGGAGGAVSEEAAPAPPAPTAVPGQSGKKGKNKRKKKGKGQKGAAAAVGDGGDSEAGIDDILRELNMDGPSNSAESEAAVVGTSSSDQRAALLAVDLKKLRADDELRKIFGSKVVDAERAMEQQQVNAERRRRGVLPRGRRRAPSKKGCLITPKDHWPAVDGGLSMERVGVREHQPLFRYTHSSAYALIQETFKEMQGTYDPNNIVLILQQHPFFVDALLAMSDLYRYSGEVAYSEEMLERCLYALETAWHPGFNPAVAACQLDYMEENNRPMFTALFRHMMNKSRQSCHNTALECCKLLLAFDKDDPCGALQTIDYMALRAQQYAYLLRFVEEWDNGETSLTLLPNFAFSSALASFMLREGGSGSGNDAGPSPDEMLIQAVLLYPLVVVKVLEQLREKGVGRDAWWGSILERPLFSKATDGGSASLSHLIAIFVERQHLVWKPPEVLKFLRTAAEAAADIAEGKRDPNGPRADDWACVRGEVFPPATVNTYRHLQVMDFSDTVNRIPPEELQAGVGGGMQIPAELAAELEAELAAAQAQGGLPAGANHLTDEEMQNANPLVMLLRSLLPWVDAGEEQPPEDEPHAAAPGEGHEEER